MSFLMAVLLGQAVVGFIIIVVLKVMASRMLIDLAMRHFDAWKLFGASAADRIVVLTHTPLKKIYADRFKRSAQRIFSSSVSVDFQIQKSIWGGAIIYIGDQVLDFSLKDRIQQAWRMR